MILFGETASAGWKHRSGLARVGSQPDSGRKPGLGRPRGILARLDVASRKGGLDLTRPELFSRSAVARGDGVPGPAALPDRGHLP